MTTKSSSLSQTYRRVNGQLVPTGPINPRRLAKMTPAQILEDWQKNRPQDWEQPTEVQTMSLDELRAKCEAEAQEAAQQEREQHRHQNAVTWVNNQPLFEQTRENGEMIYAELEKRNLHGYVSDYERVFQDLVREGKLKAKALPPQPQKIYTPEELQAMSLDEIRNVMENAGAEGIENSEYNWQGF